jgi:hypothetical protein
MPHDGQFLSPVMDMILGYKHQYLQGSYVIDFFYEQNNLRKGPTIPGHVCQLPQPE